MVWDSSNTGNVFMSCQPHEEEKKKKELRFRHAPKFLWDAGAAGLAGTCLSHPGKPYTAEVPHFRSIAVSQGECLALVVEITKIMVSNDI